MGAGNDMVGDVLSRDPGHPLRVAIDGVTASGKSTCARRLVDSIAVQGRPVVHVSMDGFHHRRDHRYRQGRTSAMGYYRDAYDFEALLANVLIPLGSNGSNAIRRRIIDLASDEPVDDLPEVVAADAIVVVDGTFLHRPPLPDYWDYSVFVDTPLDIARARGIARDADALGGTEAAGRAFDQRYHAACRIYLDEVDPRAKATRVLSIDSSAIG
ncbi:Uridine kinase [Rhodococcus sp. AW25M09]|uniref:uridine kinase n=1 Tax=Rhodococcus sp. AW25M09 TaxID=1268303 RepID=UPI0002ABB901|nr:uridine kinase [Rhodococcus sp. AW25M09]CCQ14748.1 Uridine kinase [Rhodococcus sp. AW25M09]